MSRARVLLLFKALGRGGAEQLLVNAARYLNREEFDYEVAYILPEFDELVGPLEELGLPVYSLGGISKGLWMARLRRLVGQRSARILVYTEHNVWESYHPLTRRANLLTFPLNDHVFAVSDHVRQSIRFPPSLRFLPTPPVETLYHGLDPAAVTVWEGADGVRQSLGIPEGAPLIGTVSNFRIEKGHRYLLEAAVHVRRSFPDARFVLVGHGPLEATLRRQARQMGLGQNVIFTGTRNDAPRLAAAFDVFALPSIHEGLSIALVEALAVGTPAVVTGTGGVKEVVSDGVNGVVVPPRDPLALGNAITSVLTDAALQQRLSEAGKKRAADFDIRVAVRRIEDVYREILDGPRAAVPPADRG
jgi:glycosyltransferase involved in cell wall biosynthesis